MKALEKDRRRRYETANAFAEDIQRHLTNNPVVARPPSVAYLLKKHLLRHKTAYVTVAIAFVATVTALLLGMKISARSSADAESHSASGRTEPAPRPLRRVAGTVMAEATGLPLSNALVRVAAPSTDMRHVLRKDPGIFEEHTDATGRFAIQVPEAETLALDVLSPGYETVSGTYRGGSRFSSRIYLLRAVNPMSFRLSSRQLSM